MAKDLAIMFDYQPLAVIQGITNLEKKLTFGIALAKLVNGIWSALGGMAFEFPAELRSNH